MYDYQQNQEPVPVRIVKQPRKKWVKFDDMTPQENHANNLACLGLVAIVMAIGAVLWAMVIFLPGWALAMLFVGFVITCLVAGARNS
jgi:hypothetical protein